MTLLLRQVHEAGTLDSNRAFVEQRTSHTDTAHHLATATRVLHSKLIAVSQDVGTESSDLI